MKSAVLRWLLWSLLFLGAAQAAPSDRFSQNLSAEERSASGLARLTSDEVAVIDALVRRDTVTRGGTNAEPAAPVFSQRLTADERKTAGLPKLNETELPKLDGFVERYQNAKLARTLLAPPVYLSRSSRLTPTEKKKEREIHGSFSLSYGFGSGGYSEKTGSMVLTMEDPEHGYTISIGYSQSHIKGDHVYRDPYYFDRHRDPFYLDRHRDPFYLERDR